jgi:hypothetical protein
LRQRRNWELAHDLKGAQRASAPAAPALALLPFRLQVLTILKLGALLAAGLALSWRALLATACNMRCVTVMMIIEIALPLPAPGPRVIICVLLLLLLLLLLLHLLRQHARHHPQLLQFVRRQLQSRRVSKQENNAINTKETKADAVD